MKYLKLLMISGLALTVSCQSNQQSDQQKPEETRHAIQSNSIEILEPWVRPGSEGGNSAAYLSVFNGTDNADTLLAVQSNVAEKAEIHESYEDNGMTGMRPVGPLAIGMDSTVKLQPGGFHIMLMKLRQDLSPSDSIPLSLEFRNGGNIQINAPVKVSN